MYIGEWALFWLVIVVVVLISIRFGAEWLSEQMDKLIEGRYSFWAGFLFSGFVAALLMENIDVLDLPNDSVVIPAILISMPHYVLILPWLLMSRKDSSFFHGLPDEIGHYMLMTSIVFSGIWLFYI